MEQEYRKNNKCPVCGSDTNENEHMIYCEHCGFNICKKEKDSKPKAK